MVTVRFTEPVVPESVDSSTIILSETLTGVEVTGTVGLSADQLTVTYDSLADLESLTSYTVQVQGVRDEAGNLMPPFQSAFTAGGVVDTVPPSILSTNITFDNNEGVPTNTPFTVVFSEPINPSSVTPESFSVTGVVAGVFGPVPGVHQVDSDGLRVSFIPNPSYPPGGFITVEINPGVTDLAGNPLDNFFFQNFRTSLDQDVAPPVLLGRFPEDGDLDMPSNAVLLLSFNEPLSLLNNFAEEVKLFANGVEIPGSFSLSSGNCELMFVAAEPLAQNTDFTVNIGPNLTDLAGNPFGGNRITTFRSGASTVIDQAVVTIVEPVAGGIVPVNGKLVLDFDDKVIPSTVTTRAFFSNSFPLGTVEADINRQRAIFTIEIGNSFILLPDGLVSAQLRPGAGVKDYSGRPVLSPVPFLEFKISNTEVDNTGPVIDLSNVQDGVADAPVNANVIVRLNEPISIADASSFFIRVLVGGVEIDGTVSFDATRTILTFTPASPLAPDTLYTVEVGGFNDLAGNAMTTQIISFTTGTSPVADVVAPVLVGSLPADASINAPVGGDIALTLSENIDPLSIEDSMQVSVDGKGTVGGSFSVAGNIITFSPVGPFPGSSTVRVTGVVRDVAGNASPNFNISFQTEAVPDTGIPQVIAVTPANDSLGVSTASNVVLMFSESLDPATLIEENFGLFIDGEPQDFALIRSGDNQSVTLDPLAFNLPRGVTVTVLASDHVKDFSGNALTIFQSKFSTTQNIGGRDEIWPRPGTTDVPLDSRIYYYNPTALDPVTAQNGLFVAENDIEKSGTLSLAEGGRLLIFTPDTPFLAGSFVSVFGRNELLNILGFPVFFQNVNNLASFRTVGGFSQSIPQITDAFPFGVGIPTNTLANVRFNEPLDPVSVNESTVFLEESATSAAVPLMVSLLQSDRVIRITPNVNLAPNTSYRYRISTGVRDLEGNPLPFEFSRTFTTGALEDNEPSGVIVFSPPDVAENIPIQTQFLIVQFDDDINPLTVNEQTVVITDGLNNIVPCVALFRPNVDLLLLETLTPFTGGTIYNVSIDGVEDLTGNPIVPFTSQFKTATEHDFDDPFVVQFSPSPFSGQIPPNTVFRLEANEPLSLLQLINRPPSLSVGSFTTSVSADGKTLSFVPSSLLTPGASVRVGSFSISDLTTNSSSIRSSSYSVSSEVDTVAPGVTGISPTDGLINVPVNPNIEIGFDEAVYITNSGGISLIGPGNIPVPTKLSLRDGNSVATLSPLDLLQANTTYTVRIDTAVEDLTGNSLIQMLETSFTTGTDWETTPPTGSISPADSSSNVDVNTAIVVTFNKPISAADVKEGFVRLVQNGVEEGGTTVLSPDQTVMTFTPDNPLVPLSGYMAIVEPFQDLAGNQSFSISSVFTTAP